MPRPTTTANVSTGSVRSRRLVDGPPFTHHRTAPTDPPVLGGPARGRLAQTCSTITNATHIILRMMYPTGTRTRRAPAPPLSDPRESVPGSLSTEGAGVLAPRRLGTPGKEARVAVTGAGQQRRRRLAERDMPAWGVRPGAIGCGDRHRASSAHLPHGRVRGGAGPGHTASRHEDRGLRPRALGGVAGRRAHTVRGGVALVEARCRGRPPHCGRHDAAGTTRAGTPTTRLAPASPLLSAIAKGGPDRAATLPT